MHHLQHSTTLPDLQVSGECRPVFLTNCHRNALEQLNLAFKDGRPLAVLCGEGRSTSAFIIQQFLSTLDDEVSVARITTPRVTATEFMGSIITAVGFQPKDMTLGDLESVFSMFLSFQKGHRRRTVICVENVQDCEWWVLDRIRSFVEAERDGEFGLMLLLSGNSAFRELLNHRPLSSVVGLAGKRISLAPLTLPETRQFVRRSIEAAGNASVEEVFEYQAIELIHEFCRGVPDAIYELVGQCRLESKVEGVELVTRELVERVYEVNRAKRDRDSRSDALSMVNITQFPRRPGRLIIQRNGHDVREIALRRGNVVIGRSKLCDIRIDSKIVSRHHALITYRPEATTIVDLGSTNGTSVDGYPIKEHTLVAGETIKVGDCRIEYVLDDDARTSLQNATQPDGIEANA